MPPGPGEDGAGATPRPGTLPSTTAGGRWGQAPPTPLAGRNALVTGRGVGHPVPTHPADHYRRLHGEESPQPGRVVHPLSPDPSPQPPPLPRDPLPRRQSPPSPQYLDCVLAPVPRGQAELVQQLSILHPVSPSVPGPQLFRQLVSLPDVHGPSSLAAGLRRPTLGVIPCRGSDRPTVRFSLSQCRDNAGA